MKVLILIVVDNGLVHDKKNIGSKGTKNVLILIVVDNGLVPGWFSITICATWS